MVARESTQRVTHMRTHPSLIQFKKFNFVNMHVRTVKSNSSFVSVASQMRLCEDREPPGAATWIQVYPGRKGMITFYLYIITGRY